MPKHQAMAQKNAPMQTAINSRKGTNVLKRIPGINTMNEYFIPFAKLAKYSGMLMFIKFFK